MEECEWVGWKGWVGRVREGGAGWEGRRREGRVWVGEVGVDQDPRRRDGRKERKGVGG